MIVKTQLAEQAEQFEIDGVFYVGRRVLCEDGCEVSECFENEDETACMYTVLFRLDYDRGEVFVDPSILRLYQRPEKPT